MARLHYGWQVLETTRDRQREAEREKREREQGLAGPRNRPAGARTQTVTDHARPGTVRESDRAALENYDPNAAADAGPRGATRPDE